MDTSFSTLVQKLTDAMNAPHEGHVNTEQCRVEAELIGYLLGKKIVKKSAEYVPEGFDGYPTLPLPALNSVATVAYGEYLATLSS